jgi:hypothetical protein
VYGLAGIMYPGVMKFILLGSSNIPSDGFKLYYNCRLNNFSNTLLL